MKNWKSVWLFVVFLVLLGFVSSCSTTSGPTEVKEKQEGVAVTQNGKKMVQRLVCYRNTNIKVAIGKVVCKASACNKSGGKVSGNLMALLQLAGVPNFEGIGKGLQDMFTSALQQTNCFKIINKEALESMKEYGIKTKNIKPDYIVTGAVTSINFSRKSGIFGGGLIPIIGSISSTRQKASLAMDIQLIDTKTGEIVFSKTYSADSNKTSYGVAGAGFGSGIGFGDSVSGLSGIAMEEVARDIIIRASYDIAKYLAPAENIKTELVPVSSKQ